MRSLSRRVLPAGLVLATAAATIGLSSPAAGAATAPVAPAPSTSAAATGPATGLVTGPVTAPEAVAAPPTTAAPSGTATPGSQTTIPLPGASSGVRSTASFSLVGVSWDRSTGPTATFQVRTRTGGRWTAWSTLTGTDLGADAGRKDGRTRRAATEPLYTGASNGVEVRRAAGSPPVGGAQVELVDPGVSAADAALPAPTTDGTRSQTAPRATATRAPGVPPTIISRAGWGADERLRSYNAGCSVPDYGTTVRMGFVHHTDNANTYTATEAAGIVRSIYSYHVKSQGWCDVGYNFLVDRYGRIFEGRAGGVNLPVIGAHTGGYNRDTFAASMIGNFAAVAPPTATMNAMADLFAWKLGSFYRDPQGRTVLTTGSSTNSGTRYPAGTKVTFNNISGHRDGNLTSCPGDRAYSLLPTLRSMVASRYPSSPIGAFWNLFGREKSPLAEPTVGERSVAGGLVTQFQNGVMAHSAATGTKALTATGPKYTALGGPTSILGFPTVAEAATASRTGSFARLQRGDLYYSAATGGREVHGDIGKLYAALGAERVLGYPTTDETVLADRTGRSNTFQRGAIYWLPTIGAREVHGLIATTYARLGGERSVLGYPTSNETVRPDGIGRSNTFQRGLVLFSPATGAREMHGLILQRWTALGSEANLGYPTTDELATADGRGRVSRFQRGAIYFSGATGTHEVRGAIRDTHDAAGAEAGYLGYPISNERVVAPGVVATDFQRGTITWDTTTGTVTATPDPNATPSPSPSATPSPSESPSPSVSATPTAEAGATP